MTDLWGAGGTGRRGADGTFLDEVKSWWDRGEAEVLNTVTGVSSMGFPVLADWRRAGRHHGRVLGLGTVLREKIFIS